MAKMNTKKFKTVDEYFSSLSKKNKEPLEELRAIIKNAAPDSEEVISYNMPSFKFHGMLVFYMVHKSHIGFYPASSIVQDVFKDELKDYKTSKGTIQLPIDKRIPKHLIKNIVRFRVKENLERYELKKKIK
jgi:uncharacterized protein YdhG (YjbR/CyaY superfamily)